MTNNIEKADYTTVTELPEYKASREQLDRLYQRYYFASQFCSGKDVLEVACGAGQGLGYLVKTARRIVGGDIDKNNLKFAESQYKDRKNIELKVLNAQNLPFIDKSFDVVILYEAIYYLLEPEKFIKEAHRVLRKEGILIICTVNKDWDDFNPSPYSYKYFSVPELFALLDDGGFIKTKFYGGFNVDRRTKKDILVSFVKRMAVSFDLMPKTMKAKELYKRIFFGKLYPLPAEINDGVAEYIEPELISLDSSNKSYKVIFAVASN